MMKMKEESNNGKSHGICKLGRKRCLLIAGCFSAMFGLMLLTISLTTSYWIITYERVTQVNGTTIISVNSGLWRKCWKSYEFIGMGAKKLWNNEMKRLPNLQTPNCTIIAYFQSQPKSIGELKAPEGILKEMQKAALFQVIGFGVLLIGCTMSALSFCDEKLLRFIFIASGMYVFSGVSLLIGIVLYVGCISQAFDGSGQDEEGKKYIYEFGISFYLTVMAFILSEFAGVFYLYLFMASKRKRFVQYHQGGCLIKPQGKPEIIQPNDVDMHPKKMDMYYSTFTKIPDKNNSLYHSMSHQPHTSPQSQNSYQSYNPYRRNSEQLLIKVHQISQSPCSADMACIHWPTEITNPLAPNSTMPSPNALWSGMNKKSFSHNTPDYTTTKYTPAIRAHQPSPLLPLIQPVSIINSSTQATLINPCSLSLIYQDSQILNSPEQSPLQNIVSTSTTTNSIILNPSTYFDSPLSSLDEPALTTSLQISPNNTVLLPLIKSDTDDIPNNIGSKLTKPRKITAI